MVLTISFMGHIHVRNAGAQIFGTMIGVGMFNSIAVTAGMNGKFLMPNVPLSFGCQRTIGNNRKISSATGAK